MIDRDAIANEIADATEVAPLDERLDALGVDPSAPKTLGKELGENGISPKAAFVCAFEAGMRLGKRSQAIASPATRRRPAHGGYPDKIEATA